MALELYYSSGSDVFDDYTGEPRKSIGGYLTDVQAPSDTLKALFGTVSIRMLTEGVTDYRMLYLKSTKDITALDVHTDVPLVASVVNPVDLAPAPSLGDAWIVPEDGEGDWIGKDGKKATYNGASWDFDFAPFTQWAYAFVEPTDLVDDPITGKHVRRTENVFQPPSGLTFTSADAEANKIAIGDGTLAAGGVLGMWIKRTTVATVFEKEDLVKDGGGVKVEESITLKFSFDDGN